MMPGPMHSPPAKKRNRRSRSNDEVRRGQVYRCRSRRGFKYIRLVSLRLHDFYVIARECKADGSKVSGRWQPPSPLAGMPRGELFHIFLTYRDGRWRMPVGYEPV